MILYPTIVLLFFPILIHGNCGVSLKCQCKDIPNAPSGRLSEIESAKYLSHRQTFSAGLSISDTCKVTVDISKSTVDNFFLVFLRDPKNPLIFRRFTKSMDKSVPVELTDLKCVNEGGDEFRWYHGPVKIADSFEVTLLSDEECGCSIPTGEYPVEVTQLDGSCNGYQLKCPEGQFPNLEKNEFSFGLIKGISETMTVAETSCVNGKVYYEGTTVEDPMWYCRAPDFDFIPTDLVNFVKQCPCSYNFDTMEITSQLINNENVWEFVSKLHSITGDLKTRTSVKGTAAFNTTDCTVKLTCPESKRPVVLSGNYKPIMYEQNESPIIQCADPPASHAFSETTDKTWWANGVQLQYLVYTCYD